MKRFATLVLALGLALPAPALAASLNPEQAQERRAAVLAETETMPAPAAVERLQTEAEDLGDPELFLTASDRLRDHAAAVADEDLALAAAGLADTARDIGLYLADDRRWNATDWRPVTQDQAAGLADRAKQAGDAARELAAKIVADREAAERADAAPAQTEKTRDRKRRESKPGAGLIAGGAAMLTLGVGGIGMIGAGLAIGAGHQREAESLDLPAEQPRLDELDRLGAQANLISYIGIAVAGVGLTSGIALIVVGAKKRKRGGPEAAATLNMGPWFRASGAGLSLKGTF